MLLKRGALKGGSAVVCLNELCIACGVFRSTVRCFTVVVFSSENAVILTMQKSSINAFSIQVTPQTRLYVNALYCMQLLSAMRRYSMRISNYMASAFKCITVNERNLILLLVNDLHSILC